MKVEVMLYGKLADLAERRLVMSVAGPCSVAGFKHQLAALHPALAEPLASPRTRSCIAGCIVTDNRTIVAGEVIEFLPVVSGG